MRKVLLTLLKMAFVALLLYWLFDSGKLDFHQLRLLIDEPSIFVFNLTVWLLAYVGLGTLRWYLLVRGLDLQISFIHALRLQLIGFFFNTAMPGAVGGDIVKAVYVMREQQTQRRTPAMLTVLLDRVIGLSALFILASVAVATNPRFFVASPKLLPLVGFLALGVIGMGVGLGLVMMPFAAGKDPIDRLLRQKIPGFSFLHKIYEALRNYRRRPSIIFIAVGLSIIIQCSSLSYAYFLTQRLTGQSPELTVFGTIFPIGVMTTALPLAPGGLGVGHAAFEKLFTMVGLTGGANVFNVMVLGQLALNLLGFIPYLFYRGRLPQMAEMQTELEQMSQEA